MASEHTKACWARTECTVCGRIKKPWGRSVPIEMANSMCGPDCDGYSQEPRAGHYWPGEEAADGE